MNKFVAWDNWFKIDKFVAWARISHDRAIYFLELFEWDYEKATDYYWRAYILIY